MRNKNVLVNETTYLKECKGHTRVSNHITRNENLDIIDIGLMTRLLSYSDGYVINKEVERKKTGFGVTTFNNSWSKLEKERYISSRKIHTPKGYKYIYVISNLPLSEVEPLETKTLVSTTDAQTLEIKPLDPSPGEALFNINISNKEENNIEINNIEEMSLKISNKEELVEKIEDIVFTTIQDEIKDMFRKHVVKNHIHPFFIEYPINEIYHSEIFNSLENSEDAKQVLEKILSIIEIEKFYDSIKPNSIHSKFKRKIDEYIITKNINKKEAYEKSKNFFLNQPISVDKNVVTAEMFNYFLTKSGIIYLKPTYANENTAQDNDEIDVLSSVPTLLFTIEQDLHSII